MIELEKIILEHYQRYPKMVIQDFIKLIYQNSFGPQHMGDNPSVESVIDYIETELKEYQRYEGTNQIEYIGNQYYRVNLSVIVDQLLSIEDFAKAFYQSMIESPLMEDHQINMFVYQLKTICTHLEEGSVVIEESQCEKTIEDYLDYGIRPVHHSDVFRMNYHPHYRVIHKDILKQYLEVV